MGSGYKKMGPDPIFSLTPFFLPFFLYKYKGRFDFKGNFFYKGVSSLKDRK
jgi:hypothetical protein